MSLQIVSHMKMCRSCLHLYAGVCMSADPSRVSGQPPGAGSPQLQRQSGEAHAALAICESRDARSLDLLHEKKSGKAIVPEALAVGRFACTTWKNLPEEGRRVP